MAYARLPLAQFKATYPAFSTLTEEPYVAWAIKAEGRVGESYGDDQQDATELLTAHLLALNGIGLAAGTCTLAATDATSFKSGTFSATLSGSVVAYPMSDDTPKLRRWWSRSAATCRTRSRSSSAAPSTRP